MAAEKVKIVPGAVVTQGIASRVGNAVLRFGQSMGWFPVGDPLPPQAPPGTGIRDFDYPVHYNMGTTPRQEEKISFPELRALAENYDLLRLLIETCKDQIARQKIAFRLKSDGKLKPSEIKEATYKDPRIKMLTKLFERPDGEHCWRDWVRMLSDEMLVTDATSLLPRFKFGQKEPFAFDIVDGSTIRRVLSTEGKTPQYPDVAYQQIIKGMPAVNLVAPNDKDRVTPQLVYRPRNLRTYKVYGYSPVEQIIMTVNIALRRQIHQLEFYTEGSVPDTFVGVPDTWTPDQIKKFDQWWNSNLSGNTAERRKVKFMPGGVNGQLNVEFTKPTDLKDTMDDWLARIAAFALGIPPNALVNQLNRATAESNLEEAISEGLAPRLTWIQDLMNFLVVQYFKFDDIEFVFELEKHIDPKDQADVHDKYIRNGTLSIDNVLEDLGRDPIGQDKNLIYTAAGAVTLEEASMSPDEKDKRSQANAEHAASLAPDPNDAPPGKGKPGKKLAAAQKKTLRISAAQETPSMRRHEKSIAALITKFFTSEGKRISKVVVASYRNHTGKAVGDKILKDLKLDSWSKVGDIIGPTLETTFVEGADDGETALVDLGLVAGDSEAFSGVQQASVDYAEERAADLVTGIKETTRTRIRDLVTRAVEDGMSPAELTSAIEDAGIFSAARAEMITRTELRMANVAGNLESWKESGVVAQKEWIVSDSHDADDECDDNEAEGAIDIDQAFSSGDDGPPAHPNCLCDVVGRTDSGGFEPPDEEETE